MPPRLLGIATAILLVTGVGCAADPTADAGDAAAGADPGEAIDRGKGVPGDSSPVTYRVASVIDGDTLRLADGRTVRLVGIDTPERGECGFEAATERLAALVRGEPVALGRSDEDTDRYGRLLRYVDVDATDVGLELLRDGLAEARYDSRDGYGRHPREADYVRADDGAPSPCDGGEPEQAAPSSASGGGGSGCEAGYDPCVPPFPPDLDCADVDGPVAVAGADPHGLDRDGDGRACEG